MEIDNMIGIPVDIYNNMIDNAEASVAEATTAAASDTIEAQFTNLLQELTSFKSQISDMHATVRALERAVIKNNKEISKKKPEKKTQQLLSYFDTPVVISDYMCTFMNKPVGSLVSRPAVTEYVNNYIRLNNCQDMTNRKKIIPDETLRQLLQVKTAEEEVTYFNLQKYLNIHYI